LLYRRRVWWEVGIWGYRRVVLFFALVLVRDFACSGGEDEMGWWG
jgi:hypothetical protein